MTTKRKQARQKTRGQLFTLDLLTAAVVFTAVLGMSLHLYEINQHSFSRTVEEQSNNAETMAELIASGQATNFTGCWCAKMLNTTSTFFDSCSTETCFAGCNNVFKATRLSTNCLNATCPCTTNACALEVKTC